jgi:hypothetical protein
VRQLTFGDGISESPAFVLNGRHLAFADLLRRAQIRHRSRRRI